MYCSSKPLTLAQEYSRSIYVRELNKMFVDLFLFSSLPLSLLLHMGSRVAYSMFSCTSRKQTVSQQLLLLLMLLLLLLLLIPRDGIK